MKIGFVSVLCLLFLGSCRKTTEYIKSIDNQTEFDVTIYFFGNAKNIHGDSVVVKANTNLSYSITEKPRVKDQQQQQWESMYCDPQLLENEYLVKVSANKTLIKPMHLMNYWTCEQDERRTFQKATFTITYNDIQ